MSALINIHNYECQVMMMKRKGLSVAVSVALAVGSLVGMQGANAHDYINKEFNGLPLTANEGDNVSGNKFLNSAATFQSVINVNNNIFSNSPGYGDDNQAIFTASTSLNNKFNYQVSNNSDNVIFEAGSSSTNDEFSGKTQVTVANSSMNHDAFHDTSILQVHSGQVSNSLFDGSSTADFDGEFGKALSQKNTFQGNATQILSDKSESTADTFRDNASQILNGASIATGDLFENNATQILHDSTSTLGGQFGDNTRQVMDSDKALSVEAQFYGHSQQTMTAGESNGATFYDSTVQNVNGTSKSSDAVFNYASKQIISDSGSSVGSIFNGQSVQEIATAGMNTLGADSSNDVFNDQSQLQLTSGLSSHPTFNNDSSFIVQGGKIDNATLNGNAKGLLSGDGAATGTTTVNDHSTLAVVARPVFDPTSHQADNVVLNGGTLGVLASAGNNPNPVATVGNLTVNGGTVQFGDTSPDANGHFASLAVDMMNGSGGTLKFNGSLASAKSNQLVARQIEAGHYGVSINDATDSKALTLQTLVEASHLDVIRTTGGPGSNKATYDLVDINGKKIDTIDLGIHLGKIDKDDNGTVKIHPITNQTTRSTDALLGALSSGLFISDGEMQSVRSRRGELQNGAEDTGGVWGRYLNDNTHVHAAGTAAYRLEQNGIELGGDKIINVGDDRLALGVFGSYSKNKLKQDRGNSSNVDSWGAGVYATWFGAQGYYVDSVLKYNRFSTTVRSQTETGLGVNGDFDQNGLGASLETGYRFNLPASVFIEPYVRADWFSADGKTVTLSNGLEAKADRLQSIRGEAGVSAGKSFDLNGGMTLSPYVTVAVEHEFDKSNEVRMNDAYNFNNDFSGTTGRYGLGVTSQLTRNASVYLEANYRKGEHVESPVMGNAGFRVSF
ncbi:autotransporter outer membrane beta-barrel domain-containing protein [Enterobacter asburiae]